MKLILGPKQLREVNLALLEGLKLAAHVMKDWEHLEEGQRESLIDSVDRLIAQIEIIYQIGRYQKSEQGVIEFRKRTEGHTR